jgi:hypothetical protein
MDSSAKAKRMEGGGVSKVDNCGLKRFSGGDFAHFVITDCKYETYVIYHFQIEDALFPVR